MNAPCHRCSTCSQNWPRIPAYTICPLCKTPTAQILASAATVMTKDEAEKLCKENSSTLEKVEELFDSIHPRYVFDHRFGAFMRMGFGPAESTRLAETREDTHRVRKMLDGGCSFDLAVEILL